MDHYQFLNMCMNLEFLHCKNPVLYHYDCTNWVYTTLKHSLLILPILSGPCNLKYPSRGRKIRNSSWSMLLSSSSYSYSSSSSLFFLYLFFILFFFFFLPPPPPPQILGLGPIYYKKISLIRFVEETSWIICILLLINNACVLLKLMIYDMEEMLSYAFNLISQLVNIIWIYPP